MMLQDLGHFNLLHGISGKEWRETVIPNNVSLHITYYENKL